MATTTDMPDARTGQEGLTDKISSAASQAQQKAQEAGQNALNKIDQTRESTAGSLQSAASKMHATADAGAEKFSSMVHSAADTVESGASYLRSHDTRQMIGDVENVVRSYPGRSLLIAAAVGFLFGRAFWKD